MRRWNGWGDDAIDAPVPPAALELLGELVGPGTPPRDAMLGFHPDVPAAAADMIRTAETRDPDPAVHARYDDLFRAVYRPMYGRLRPLYRELRRLG